MPDSGGSVVQLNEYAGVLKRGSRLIGASVLVGAVLGTLLLVVQPRSYVAEARVQVRPIVADSDDPNLDLGRQIDMDTEIGIARSQRVAEQALALRTATTPWQDYRAFAKSMHQAAAYDQALAAYASSRQLHLASTYETMADHLLQESQAIKALIDSEQAALGTAELLQAYDILHRNTTRAAKLKDKASQLLAQAAHPTAEDLRKLAAQEDRLAAKTLLEQELQWRRENR